MSKTTILKVQNIEISVTTTNSNDFICITDIANSKESNSRAADIIKNCIRTLQLLNFWALGNKCIIPILKWSNLTTLKCRQA